MFPPSPHLMSFSCCSLQGMYSCCSSEDPKVPDQQQLPILNHSYGPSRGAAPALPSPPGPPLPCSSFLPRERRIVERWRHARSPNCYKDLYPLSPTELPTTKPPRHSLKSPFSDGFHRFYGPIEPEGLSDHVGGKKMAPRQLSPPPPSRGLENPPSYFAIVREKDTPDMPPVASSWQRKSLRGLYESFQAGKAAGRAPEVKKYDGPSGAYATKSPCELERGSSRPFSKERGRYGYTRLSYEDERSPPVPRYRHTEETPLPRAEPEAKCPASASRERSSRAHICRSHSHPLAVGASLRSQSHYVDFSDSDSDICERDSDGHSCWYQSPDYFCTYPSRERQLFATHKPLHYWSADKLAKCHGCHGPCQHCLSLEMLPPPTPPCRKEALRYLSCSEERLERRLDWEHRHCSLYGCLAPRHRHGFHRRCHHHSCELGPAGGVLHPTSRSLEDLSSCHTMRCGASHRHQGGLSPEWLPRRVSRSGELFARRGSAHFSSLESEV